MTKIATFNDGTTKTTRSDSAKYAWRIVRNTSGEVLKMSQSKTYENAVKSSKLAIDDCWQLNDVSDLYDLTLDYYTARGHNRRATMKQVRAAKEENARRRELRAKLVDIEIAEYVAQ